MSQAAIRWLRANAAKFGINAKAIGVTGLSAGGHLAALLTTSGGVKELEGENENSPKQGLKIKNKQFEIAGALV